MTTQTMQQDLFQFVLHLGDNNLISGHRLSEWCGHAPVLEEDIAMANIALDLLGQATFLLQLAGEIEGNGRDEDQLVYFREAVEYRNFLLLEQPKGDFAYTMVRQFLFSAYNFLLYEKLVQSTHEKLAGIAEKSLKEVRYHVRHSSEWVVRLGDGTEESHRRAQDAVDDMWTFTGEFFSSLPLWQSLQQDGILPDVSGLESSWQDMVSQVFSRATLEIPIDCYMQQGSLEGKHTEHLGYLLAEMQIVARSFPGVVW